MEIPKKVTCGEKKIVNDSGQSLLFYKPLTSVFLNECVKTFGQRIDL